MDSLDKKYKPKLDKQIEAGSTFIKIALDLIKTILYTGSTVKRTYIDINSCISVLFRLPLKEDTGEIEDTIKQLFQTFIESSLQENKELIFLYTIERSAAHVEIFPEWMKIRNDRVDLKTWGPLNTILYAIQLFSKDEKRIKLVNIHKVHPALVIHQNELGCKNRYLILSKDNVFKTITDKRLDLFDGAMYYSNQHYFRRKPDGIEIQEPEIFLPYYMAIRGSSREGFEGIYNMGPNRTKTYLEVNKLNIKAGTFHKYKEWCDKYVALFDINKLLVLNKEKIPII